MGKGVAMPRKPKADSLDLFVPDLIVAGDLHAGNLKPECRDDDYLDTLCGKVEQIAKLQAVYGCPVVFPGDLFDFWKADSVLLNRLLAVWPTGPVLGVPGQHDLPQHNLELLEKTGFQTLVRSGKLFDVSAGEYAHAGYTVFGAAWDMVPATPDCSNAAVLVWHVTTWEKPFAPGQKPGEATRLLKANKGWDLIVTGDNHQTFECQDGNRSLLNAGSVMRKTSDQIDHRPCVYLWRRDGKWEKRYLRIDPQAVTRDTVEREKAKEKRRDAFVEKLAGDGEVSLSFDDNVDGLLATEEDTVVKRLTLECCGR